LYGLWKNGIGSYSKIEGLKRYRSTIQYEIKDCTKTSGSVKLEECGKVGDGDSVMRIERRMIVLS
jgi:hypothetical protein